MPAFYVGDEDLNLGTCVCTSAFSCQASSPALKVCSFVLNQNNYEALNPHGDGNLLTQSQDALENLKSLKNQNEKTNV